MILRITTAMKISPLHGRDGVKKSATERIVIPLTHEGLSSLHPLPRWGEGKVNIRFNSLAPLGERGEHLISVHKGG